MKNESDVKVKVYKDFPKEIQDRRNKQWPKLKRAREDGKTAFSANRSRKNSLLAVFLSLLLKKSRDENFVVLVNSLNFDIQKLCFTLLKFSTFCRGKVYKKCMRKI